ncbi:MAG: (2Fe-2S) ferredoxin domain-containing protein [Anaerolineaceae bacterium]|jgi:NADP-reducing hydrogenase subunit HndB|nr:(2Fe-2S) ferredoxin domain-containing protein [Anaerolineaceae bacterium]MDI9530195.1 (2Fe-2S) ferredoxin domain-containing protein [Chloroflexota bacterium]NLE92488.1 (2Fe-2S) ferredoxin domain-containing protein [Chloroflexota bacterium]HOF29089.1 (2Fe-2S) ferredoxin domain-containing protein [Anaerolineaceae bacterium]
MPTIKTIDDLERLREKAKKVKEMRDQTGKTQIVVGMGTVGIAAGARETLKAILTNIEEKHLSDIILRQTANIGLVGQDPVVQVTLPGAETVTYGKITPAMATRIMEEHVVQGNIVQEFQIDA